MIFISAGHNSKSKTVKADPGAISSSGIKEGDLAIEFRDLVCQELKRQNRKFIIDYDEETLQAYLNRINTGSGSVVIEYHFDAGPPTASGSTSLHEIDADKMDKAFCKELVEATSRILNIPSRGIKSETTTRHGRLALMKENGIVCLHEICFISNNNDLIQYQTLKHILAIEHANIIIKFEDLIP